jgi:1,2-diacylglycerol 3-beta-galactosyltransferase
MSANNRARTPSLHVLIAYSDTGGGHRAAARHLQSALERVGGRSTCRLVDPYAQSGRWPFNALHRHYSTVVTSAPWIWGLGFRFTNSRTITMLAQRLAWLRLRSAFLSLRAEGRPDVIVSTHPLLTAPLRRAFPEVPIAVVVTDLVTGHRSWYEPEADLLIVPTRQALDTAKACGVSPERVVEEGLPIDPSFNARPGERGRLAEDLGWSTTRPTILIMGGGDGVGPMEEIAQAIDASGLPCDIAVVAGRNTALEARLRSRQWSGSVRVYGFVEALGTMMRAAFAVVTKAGPGSISEAFAAGCPVVLSSAIPGQEKGNVPYVLSAGAGRWAPTAKAVVDALSDWLIGPDGAGRRERASKAALAATRPMAADRIAVRVLALAAAGRQHTAVSAAAHESILPLPMGAA